jgi:hypothetical protein
MLVERQMRKNVAATEPPSLGLVLVWAQNIVLREMKMIFSLKGARTTHEII